MLIRPRQKLKVASLRSSLELLPVEARWKLALVVPAQILAAVMDLAGVLLIGAVAALALSAASGTPLPSTVGAILERLPGAPNDTLRTAALFAALAASLLVSKSILSAWLNLKLLRFLAFRQAEVSGRLASTLLGGSLLAVQRQSTQVYAYALTNGVSACITGMVGSFVTILSESILLVVLTLGLLAIDPMITLAAFVYFLILAHLLQRILSGRIARLGHLSAATFIDSFRYIQDALVTYREIFALNRREPILDRFVSSRQMAARSAADTQFVSQVPKFALEVGMVGGGVFLTLTLVALRSPSEAAAVLALFLAAATRVMPSVLRLQGALLTYRASEGPARPTIALAKLETGELGRVSPRLQIWQPPIFGQTHEDFVPEVVLEGACFTYPGQGRPALDGIFLRAAPGELIAIVGPSGAGKSTLADVILGLVEVDEGAITISGVSPLEAISRWPGSMAYVPQSVAVVEGTIRENVALGIPAEAINDSLVWNALTAAHLTEFVLTEREGLDTMVGERGTQLSGGQRQRLGIARALYSRPRLLILDEATSSLDSETEQAISATLSDLGGEVTTIVIAHRLATIRSADTVNYLEDGRIVASGTFSEVKEASKSFAEQARLLGL